MYDAAHAAGWAYVSWVGLVLHLRRSCSLTPAGEEPDHPDCDLSDLPKLDDLAHDLSHLSGELDDLHHDLSGLSKLDGLAHDLSDPCDLSVRAVKVFNCVFGVGHNRSYKGLRQRPGRPPVAGLRVYKMLIDGVVKYGGKT